MRRGALARLVCSVQTVRFWGQQYILHRTRAVLGVRLFLLVIDVMIAAEILASAEFVSKAGL